MKRKNNNAKKTFIGMFLVSITASCAILCKMLVAANKDINNQQYETSLVINQAVSIKKKALRTDFFDWNEKCEQNLIVVNKNNNIPKQFTPKLKLFGDIEVAEQIYFALSELLNDAEQEGIKLWISAGYRSIERQKQLFQIQINDALSTGLNQSEALKKALEENFLPGYSEHHTGLAIDFNAADVEFAETAAYNWLLEHAQNYGFILRYPQDKEKITGRIFEPAHFRYVGEEHASTMQEQNLCLEEYASNLAT